ncbi:MAG: chitobiase/beta-hexosaminidase C-terminal domain-containing protein, partial [Muribaculaceae bacterium]|nr:chitobiase/beta-hexosaminidase C-terminal domain-containing protein [Muribaculaceae bacterium]
FTQGEVVAPVKTVTDVLNNANTVKSTASTYKDIENVTVSSDAVYFLQAAGSNGTIQLRSSGNNSGIVTTASGGTVKKITVTYNKATSHGRTLDVYAKNTPYEKPSDLYGDAAGTNVASLVYDSGAGFTYTYTFEGEYQYIGMRSKSSAMYIDNIEIEWETVGEDKVFAPTFDPVAGMVKAGTEVTLTTPTEGAEIYYTTDESEPTAASTKYTAPIAINDYTVIKAVAIKNGKASEVVTAEYMLMPAIEDLSPLMDFPDKTQFTVNCELTVVYANGAYVYVYDGTNYGLLYKNNLGLAAGDVIAAGWDATLSIYSGLYEIVPETELTKSESEPKAATPMVVDAEDAEYTLMPYNMNRYFTLNGVVFEAATPAGKSNFTGKMGETEVTFRNNFEIASVEAGTYSVTGFVGVYNDAVQFYPIAYVAPEPEDPNMLWKSDVEAEQSTADWRRVFTMTAEEAQEKIAVGDYLLVTVSYVDPEGGWPQVAILPIEGWPPYTNEGVSKDSACPFVVRFPIAGPTAKQMWANGFGVSGGDVRISKVALEKATEELDPNTVWFGGKQCGWGNGISLNKEIFADCKAGDKVVINYEPGEATLQVMPGGWSGPNFPIYAGLPFFVR